MSGGWNTIESDAGVFTSLLENLGVSGVQFEELLTLDPTDLAALQPLYGVIFLFRYPTETAYTSRERPLDGEFDRGASDDIFFASQTIQNACATQALLSVLLNRNRAPAASSSPGDVGDGDVDLGDGMREFRDFAMALPPELRGEVLGNSDLIRGVHNSFARSSPFADETARDGAEGGEDAFHFVAYTPVDGTLYELDGLQPAPISHGPCDGESFPSRVVDVLRRRVERYAASEIRFNLLAVCRDLRLRARETGDVDLLEREERKRRDWAFENALRRHNFVGFAGEVLRHVVAGKIAEGGDDACDRWVRDSLGRKTAAARAMRGGIEDVDMAG
ncbi:ubiquitin carboxyl-terminal hydrolase L5 [Geosmithia morbida]|uniref:Ubiquitin carboxyl-terminal hydrolase n=1 Tax=Geosmithia morbida TaxID=1094350 RepID=A0A9P4YSP3_9HYPO|nr:ubiquitin carboxyl-terminal hydrolase L5 [Geosmithia morbida]KAF4121812.1 ubiquitin carboxyl-terminal hydrolase L5 [Geosmithia morbida]